MTVVNLTGLQLSASAYLNDKTGSNSLFNFVCNSFGGDNCIENEDFTFLGLNFSSYGIIFFGTQLVGFAFSREYNSYLIYVVILFALPFVLYSLYIQFFVRKKICAICLLIIFTFLGNALLHYSYFDIPSLQLDIEVIYILTLCTIWIALLYDYLILSKNSKAKTNSKKFNYFFSRPGSMVLDRKANEYSNEERSTILLPAREKKVYDIALHLHPQCKHCASALREILNLSALDERCQVKVYIHYYDKISLSQFCDSIKDLVRSNRINNLYDSYIAWKKKIRQNTRSHNLDKAPPYFPYLIVNNNVVSSFQGYENIKVALALDQNN